ncbi:coproporphyrinogen dehydrogenase HemZ [Desulfuribacillus alkaliarsenatis]|uniref:Coproporphyrinogen dehydrogenase HemZ n=1 Tax=Desulfuribacillus alkaliarsenatis TaxID=766136 RepID=A0A1E5G1L1_9FIRM|nr:coproporphyrinogen dehydrogenase HemZ [Desulfuribacillus alkaliarsenatis]OEF96328.1 coproporphyrinogen dehydrogenase HemZ [Desulfuribacillus alkaliarsenatis]
MSIDVYLDEIAQEAIVEIKNLHKALYGTELSVVDYVSHNCLSLEIEECDNLRLGMANYKQGNLELVLAFNENKTLKQNVARLFVLAIFKISPEIKDILPWGILTGIRPLKLYRKLTEAYKSQELAKKDLNEFYLLSDEKIRLLEEIYNMQAPILANYKNEKYISLYIGIPYCPTRCSYCTFPSFTVKHNEEVKRFTKALLRELRWILELIEEYSVKVAAIYIGGGTPSTLSASEIHEILNLLSKYINFEEVEVTFEAGRPDTITDKKLHVLNSYGVQRISINPQTFNNETLKRIGRHHTTADVIKAYELSKGMFKYVNMDFIIGLPGESIEDFQKTLAYANQLQPESITIHTLSIKTKAKIKDEITAANLKLLPVKDMIDYSKTWAQENDYKPYYIYRQKNIAGNFENIGYSKLGSHSIYNILIMEEAMSIIGVGCGAVSKLKEIDTGVIKRVANPVNPDYYVKNIDKIIQNKQNQIVNVLTKLC